MKKENLQNSINSMRMPSGKRNSYGSSNFFMEDLDKELKAADKLFNQSYQDKPKNSEEQLKTSNLSNSANDNRENPNFTFTDNKINTILDSQLIKYQKQLKSFGFPLIGNFYFSSDEDKEKTFKFFDFLIMKKSTENEEKMKYKKQIDLLSTKLSNLQNENEKLTKELQSICEENKKFFKDKKDFEMKINKTKESLEKQVSELKSNNVKLTNKLNVLIVDKKSLEEKFSKISENYLKITNKSGNINLRPANNIEIIENLKKNEILKILGKVRGTEKLIETFKNGFNESLRELLFEISALKNFIYELNSDLIGTCKLIEKEKIFKFQEIDYNLLNMPFLDTVTQIKFVFKNNFKIISQILYSCGGDFIFEENFEIAIPELEKKEIENFEKYEKMENIEKCDMTFSKSIRSERKEEISYQKSQIKNNLIFDLEEPEQISGKSYISPFSTLKSQVESNKEETQLPHITEDYENELDFLKNKWVKTLMSIKNTTDDEN
jgi:hypothetical protein